MQTPTNRNQTLIEKLRRFHDDERGMETLQIVMIVGIAAVILIIMWQFFPRVRVWLNSLFLQTTEIEPMRDRTAAEMKM